MRAIEDTTEVGDVIKGGEHVASVDGFGFVAVAGPNKNGPIPKSGLKTVSPLQHPAPSPYPSAAVPQHQYVVAEPLTVGQAYRLLKLSMLAIIGQSDLGGEQRMSQDRVHVLSLHPGQQFGELHVMSVHPPRYTYPA